MAKVGFDPQSKVNKNGALLLPKLVRENTGIEIGDVIIFKSCEVKNSGHGKKAVKRIFLEVEKKV